MELGYYKGTPSAHGHYASPRRYRPHEKNDANVTDGTGHTRNVQYVPLHQFTEFGHFKQENNDIFT